MTTVLLASVAEASRPQPKTATLAFSTRWTKPAAGRCTTMPRMTVESSTEPPTILETRTPSTLMEARPLASISVTMAAAEETLSVRTSW